MDGLEIARKLRSESNRTRILVLSAKDYTSDKIRGLNPEIDDYTVKPFLFEEMLARTKAIRCW